MGRKRIILLSAVLATALLVVAICLVIEPGGPPEPKYEGKPLSFYLREHQVGGGVGYGPVRRGDPRATTAVREIWTNAIPTLLGWLKAKHSPGKAKLAQLCEHLPWIRYDYWDAAQRNMSACTGFNILRSAAAAAVPQIMEIFRLQISEPSQVAAALSLGYIGKDSAPALPMLMEESLKKRSARVRAACIQALGEIRTSPDEAVRCLVQCMADPDGYVRYAAADSLATYGSFFTDAAKPAVPALLKALNDNSGNAAAELALKLIDPAALEKARKERNVPEK